MATDWNKRNFFNSNGPYYLVFETALLKLLLKRLCF